MKGNIVQARVTFSAIAKLSFVIAMLSRVMSQPVWAQSFSTASAIDNSGDIAGGSCVDSCSGFHAFLLDKGIMKDLSTLGGAFSEAFAINKPGGIVGESDDSAGESHAFLSRGGVMTDLGTLGGTHSAAFGINDRGEIVGEAETATGDVHAFLFKDGVMHDLGTLP